MWQLFNKNSKLMPSSLQFVHSVLLWGRIFNIFSSFALSRADVGGSYSHFLRFRGYGSCFGDNILSMLNDPSLPKESNTLWSTAVKELLSELWFEINQKVFHDKSFISSDRFAAARLLASSWSPLSPLFADYFIQDICLNWNAFLFTL